MSASPQAVSPQALAYHEMRAPIGLLATAAWLAAEDCADPVTRERIKAIAEGAERILGVVREFLAPEEPADKTDEFSPHNVVRELAGPLREIGWRVSLCDEPQGVARGSAESYRALLQSVFNNCLDHASQRSGVSIDVTVDSGQARVEVANGRCEEKRHAGLGFGRYIVAQLAERCGARVNYSVSGDRYVTCIEVPLEHRPNRPDVTLVNHYATIS